MRSFRQWWDDHLFFARWDNVALPFLLAYSAYHAYGDMAPLWWAARELYGASAFRALLWRLPLGVALIGMITLSFYCVAAPLYCEIAARIRQTEDKGAAEMQ